MTNAAEAAEEQARFDALQGAPGNKDPNIYPTPAPRTPVPVPTGILELPSLVPGWGSRYHIKNKWQEYVNGNGDRVGVYAGSVADEPIYAKWYTPEQGALIILDFPADHSLPWGASHVYISPTRTGKLRVVSFNGLCLSLLSEDNTSYEFDVASRQWSCTANTNP